MISLSVTYFGIFSVCIVGQLDAGNWHRRFDDDPLGLERAIIRSLYGINYDGNAVEADERIDYNNRADTAKKAACYRNFEKRVKGLGYLTNLSICCPSDPGVIPKNPNDIVKLQHIPGYEIVEQLMICTCRLFINGTLQYGEPFYLISTIKNNLNIRGFIKSTTTLHFHLVKTEVDENAAIRKYRIDQLWSQYKKKQQSVEDGSSTSNQPQPQVQPHVQSHAQPHVQSHAQSHAQPHAQSHVQPHAQPHVQPHAQPHVQQHAQPHVQPHAQPHAQQHAQPHSQSSDTDNADTEELPLEFKFL